MDVLDKLFPLSTDISSIEVCFTLLTYCASVFENKNTEKGRTSY